MLRWYAHVLWAVYLSLSVRDVNHQSPNNMVLHRLISADTAITSSFRSFVRRFYPHWHYRQRGQPCKASGAVRVKPLAQAHLGTPPGGARDRTSILAVTSQPTLLPELSRPLHQICGFIFWVVKALGWGSGFYCNLHLSNEHCRTQHSVATPQAFVNPLAGDRTQSPISQR